MGVAVSQQLFSLTGALLLGLGLGLVYDLLRTLRRRSGAVLGALLDLLFWLLATLALFLWSLWTGAGVVRFYIVLALMAGTWLWFQTFSPAFLRLSGRLADVCARVAHILFSPVRAVGERAKKFLFS